MDKKSEHIYTGLKIKKMNKAYRKAIRKSSISKSVIPNENNDWWIYEKVIKFFIRIILLISTPRAVWQNKSKTDELIDRTYSKFNAKDSVFVSISLAFYFLISFVPILTIVVFLMNLLPETFSKTFINEIMHRIIPGAENVLSLNFKTGFSKSANYTAIAFLLITSTWIGSSGWGRFIYLQNYVYKHESLGNFFLNRLRGFFIVIGISLYIFIMALFYVSFFNYINPKISTNTGKNIFFYISFDIYLFIFLYIGFILIYKLTPSFKNPLTSVLPGVLITTLPNLVFISVFGHLISNGNYYKNYGIVGAFIYLALFVSSLSYFIFLGIIINEAYYKTYYSSYTTAKRNFWIIKV
ncbi:YihY/virulence factor BrkB family protein [Mycoplasmopsis mucosicanis]|uniref:YihY/virulence factor BrkB family protein n=1 Tax=Mycoplasmopsis mucosicanis TaxID=458208 RepID=A0A507SQG6_9BACT|nr:YhjD/YihY/BrkB family envelope integrity protein [Mycoplasmopsis mucosicanis]TQC54050.1 YihY/virulence factor BrkB family protein [Mycoplasmopsis mucosicanis]